MTAFHLTAEPRGKSLGNFTQIQDWPERFYANGANLREFKNNSR